MILTLRKLPPLRGIYNGKVPNWARYLAPEAADSLMMIEQDEGLIYTSVWRSANGSLWAIKNKQGAMPPGFSAHNYGFAVDLTVDQILKEKGWSYTKLLGFMKEYGWYCHRRDGKTGGEYWHFNYFGDDAKSLLRLAKRDNSRTWHLPVEEVMRVNYDVHWHLTVREVQSALKKLKFYFERVDGTWGPYSREALNSFQRAYKMRETRIPTARDERTLAFCTATKKIV
jgi:hypothetical protein